MDEQINEYINIGQPLGRGAFHMVDNILKESPMASLDACGVSLLLFVFIPLKPGVSEMVVIPRGGGASAPSKSMMRGVGPQVVI